jgi:pilus assembly protein Flp/PilA
MAGSFLHRFLRDDSGATAVEYALIASVVFFGIVGSVNAIGSTLSTTFQSVATAFP